VNTFEDYRREKAVLQREIFERGADARKGRLYRNRVYYQNLRETLRSIVEPGKRVLCLRSDTGQYLEWVEANPGVGVDISDRIEEIARDLHPEFEFHTVEAIEALRVEGVFDYILIIDAINEFFDVQQVLESLVPLCSESTRIVIMYQNFLWQPLAELAGQAGLLREKPPQNWLSHQSLSHLLHLSGFELVCRRHTILWPFRIPLLERFVNRTLARLPFLERLCLIDALVARRAPNALATPKPATVSVVVPCRNEAGNIEDAVRRTPEMGAGTEIIFCDDQSTDGTADEVRRMQALFPERNIRLVEGPAICKAENVWCGFAAAENDILMILDGDLAVPPEDLPRFYNALVQRRGEFINGTRMIYPMRDQAMRLANIFGNKMFGMLFSHILRQDISDTLCGTKALWRADFERMRSLRGTWGIDDRWGDYELIFGAAKLNLKRVDMPVHYMERTYGETKMTGRLGNALVMLKMCLAAYRKLR
jgi:hypothetical protein